MSQDGDTDRYLVQHAVSIMLASDEWHAALENANLVEITTKVIVEGGKNPATYKLKVNMEAVLTC